MPLKILIFGSKLLECEPSHVSLGSKNTILDFDKLYEIDLSK
jgi:hypothetical protein